MKCFYVFIVLLFVLPGVPGAPVVLSEDESSLSCRQEDGQVVTLPKKPRRVVICYTSLAQAWYGAGGTALAIPETRTLSTLPAAARKLPSIGSFNQPNAEKILALQPDLVLLTAKLERHRALQALLRRSGIASVLLEYDNYHDYLRQLAFAGRLTGQGNPAEEVDAAVRKICRRAATAGKPSFISIFASGFGYNAETSKAHTAMMATMLGGRNIVPDGPALRIKFSMEELTIRDPDVILIVTMGDSEAVAARMRRELMNRPMWRSLRAVKSGRVHFLPNELFLYLPGERFPEAFACLSNLLHPESGGKNEAP